MSSLGDKCANIAESHDKKCKRLREKVDVIVICPEHKVVTTAEQEVRPRGKL